MTFARRIVDLVGKRARGAAPLFMFALSAALASCHGSPVEDVLQSASPAPAPAVETLGAGPVKVGVLLPRGADGALGARAQRMCDAVKLALDDLGGGELTLTIYDTYAGGEPDAKASAMRAIEAGAEVIIGPASSEQTAAVATIPTENRPLVLSLSSNSVTGAPGIFKLASDEVNSAVQGARVAIASKKPKMLAVFPNSLPEVDRQRLRGGIEAEGGQLVDLIAYGEPEASAKEPVQAILPSLQDTEAVVVLGAGTAPAIVVEAIRADGTARSDLAIVGTSQWPSSLYGKAAVEGAIIAKPDEEGLRQISARHEDQSGRRLSYDTAHAYDAVAIVAGILRTKGADALTAENLKTRTGFRGATGTFRFREDGSVERRFAIHRIAGGELELIQAAPEGF